MVNRHFISLLGLVGSLFALGVIGLGAFTRLVNAGLGCPDWPGCYGHLIVPLTENAKQLANLHFPNTPLETYKAWAEMIHRYFVGGLSFFLFSIVIFIFAKREIRTRSNVILALSLILLLVYQILLGRYTVTLKLLPIIVTQHLLGGFFILAILWLIYLNNSTYPSLFNNNKSHFAIAWPIIALILLLSQISLGAWTSTNYASLSCPDFPFCVKGQSIPLNFKEAFTLFPSLGINYEGGVLSDTARQTIQMMHRWGALIFTSYMFILLSMAYFKLKHSFELMKSLFLVLGLLLIQLCIGIANIIFKLPLLSAISHNLMAVLLLLALITFSYKLAITHQKVSA